MMSGIGSFIASFCTGCVLLGFLYFLCPSGNMSAIVKYVFCLCMVCCVIGSVINIKSVDFTHFDNKKTGEILSEQSVAATAQTIFAEALRQGNIYFTKILVDVNKLDDGSIVISRVTVYTNQNKADIVETIGSKDYEVVIINE